MADKGTNRPIIIIRRKKSGGGGHHGGAWKVAYADFVTAMMAFFMVMWLVAAVSKDQRAAIFDYFKNPSMEPGKSSKPAPGQMGPGGASSSPINLGGGMDAPKSIMSQSPGAGAPVAATLRQDVIKDAAAAEKLKLESLMEDLRKAVSESQALKPFKDQLLLDITPDGLRIQIVDEQNRPMFDLGSSRLKDYTQTILVELAKYLSTVPNRISLSGHTDVRPYPGRSYSNWELSADRANAARRALEMGGLDTAKVALIVGLSSSVLFDKEHPGDPINRRISIIVMTKAAEETALKNDNPVQRDTSVAPSTLGAEGAASTMPASDASAPATTATKHAVPEVNAGLGATGSVSTLNAAPNAAAVAASPAH
jgi:chemotaxis protein MotB